MPDTQITGPMVYAALDASGHRNTDYNKDWMRAALEAALSGHVVVPRTISDSQLNKALGREEDARITPMFSMFRDFYHNIVAAPPVPEMEG